MNILITGATGFVGRALLGRLCAVPGNHVAALARGPVSDIPSNAVIVFSEDFSLPEDKRSLLDNVEVVVHCGARAHIMRDDPRTSLDEYRRVNVVETMKLAYQAVEAKVRRFVFISSIKVNGETTPDGKPFTANDDPCPADPYGISKMEAEKQLQSLAASTGMELVIIRPVLVYGPNVKANFAKLLIWVDKGIPFPFGRVSNKRSFLYLDNLVEFVALCITHRAAANEIFLVSDAEDISVASMVQKIARCLGRRAVLLPIPMKLLRLGACMLGKKDTAVRLLSSLQVDTTKNSVLLGWQPPYSLDDGIEHTVKYYIEAKPR